MIARLGGDPILIRRRLIRFGLLATLLGLDLFTALAIGQGRVDLLIYLAAAVLAGFCFVFWRPALYLVILLVFVEGFLRNLLATPQVLLLKDLMLAAIYLRVFGGRLLSGTRPLAVSPATAPIFAFAAIVLVQCLNPHIASPLEALIGLRTWLFYLLLFFVAQELVSTEAEAWRVVAVVVASALPVGLIAIGQWLVGPAAYSALGGAFRTATFTTAGHGGDVIFRPNSTFAWPSHFALYLAIVTIMCLAGTLAAKGRLKLVAGAMLVFLLAVNVIEAQRTIYVLLPPLLGLMLIARGTIARGRVLPASIVIVGLVMGGLLLLDSHLRAFDRPMELLTNGQGVFGERASGFFIYVREALVSPIGLGTGATSIGSRYVLTGIPLFVENSAAKVIGDLSLLGFALYLWVFGALLQMAWRAMRTAAAAGRSSAADYAVGILACTALVLYTGYDLAVAAILFWVLAGSLNPRWTPAGQPSHPVPVARLHRAPTA
ncbi:MAG: hypothetical protein NVS9B1_18630 [Candidatus Dormibacteraceae bacterium]